ncbi:glutathione S-transferase family protein [Sorangium sp. So ce1151]|uniref:glutathione S-transferase family protein n=1 Tax=Sorangium sp. So ce1151 TaxID=3133332 RepID=UPI003F5E3ABB
MLTIYGCKGCGSTLIEAVCALLGEEFKLTEVAPWEPGPAVEALRALNPLLQVPTVVLDDGTVMTESVAIILWLLERHPDTDLAPRPGDPRRAAFLRRLVYFPSAIYPMYTVGDFPERWVKDKAAQAELKEATVQRTLGCWSALEASFGEGPFFLGEQMTVLDVYASVLSRWRPGRDRIREVAPRAVAAAERAEAHPSVAPVMARNFGNAA